MYQTLNTLHISESAVAQNISYYQSLHPSSLIAPVIKANAYGHGLIDMANIYQRMGQIMLCVDSVYESQQIRMYSGYTGDILVMGYTMPQNLAYKDMKGLHFVAYDMETIETLYREHVDPKIHLKLDTGMNRQGIKLEDLDDFLVACQQISGFRLEGLCSHLYDADNPDGHLSLSHSHQQLERFLQGLSIVR
ncbi:MAG: alanine racemase [Patescibacteria group bacterium]|nr:alanine racemase [Patescibacteria group bacterium]